MTVRGFALYADKSLKKSVSFTPVDFERRKVLCFSFFLSFVFYEKIKENYKFLSTYKATFFACHSGGSVASDRIS